MNKMITPSEKIKSNTAYNEERTKEYSIKVKIEAYNVELYKCVRVCES